MRRGPVIFNLREYRSVMLQLVPHHNWSPRPSVVNYVAVDGLPGPSMAAMDGLLCCKWSPTTNRLKVDKTVAGIPTERSDC